MKRFNMNKKIAALIVALLVAGVLAACSGNIASSESSVSTTAEETTVASETSVSETSSDTTSAATSADDLVSDRDMDPSYDEESAVAITLNGDSATSSDSAGVTVEDGTVTITAEGTYIISGTLSDGQIVVDAGDEDKIQLVLRDCDITSSDSAPIYVKNADKVFITLDAGSENTLMNVGAFEADGDTNIDGVIFSKDDLTINGLGGLTINTSDGNGIVCKDELVVTGGSLLIDCSKSAIEANDSIVVTDGSIIVTSCNDGLHAENDDDDTLGFIVISGGTFDITAADDGIHAVSTITIEDGNITVTAAEAIEGTCVTINGGTLSLTASDDGINAAQKSDSYTPTIEINGGDITIVMGEGDTDALDSNGNLIITGGTMDITATWPFDYDGTCEFTGGTITVNGSQVDTITNQFEGGPGGMDGQSGMGPGYGSMPDDFDPADMGTPPDGFDPSNGGGGQPDGNPPEGFDASNFDPDAMPQGGAPQGRPVDGENGNS